MTSKENLLNNIHKVFREDLWLNEIFNSCGLVLDTFLADIAKLERNYWFDTIDEEFLPIYEKLLGIKTNPNNSIENRRAYIEAKWKSDSKADIKLIQAVCDSWKNGDVDVAFTNGKIVLKFNGEFGVPTDLNTLLGAIDEVKPAHLALDYIFMFLLIQDIDGVKTLEQMETLTLDKFAG